MRDLNRRNEFARKGATGQFWTVTYGEAWLMLKRGEPVYERVLPEHGITRAEKARIPWTLVDVEGPEV
jgi:hypothetical protein